ncbi:MAG: AMP-binding protein [Myxococcaceae bacterium]|nr:AMP-binding protein [Myxococcaceae bacterium]
MSLPCPVASAAATQPHGVGLEFRGRSSSWRELDQQVRAWEEWLAAHEIGACDSVATLAWNRPELATLLFALARRRARLVPLNARLTPIELAALAPRTGAKQVLADDALLDRLPAALPFPRLEAGRASEVATIDPAVDLAALFTSGTTGVPSLVPLTVGNFLASARANASNLGASPAQVWLGTLPLFHVGGLSMLFRCALMGARLVLEPAFDAARAAALLSRGDVTHASFVPTSLTKVLDALTAKASSSLEAVLIGGGPMGAALLSRARAAGLPVLQTYGLTEACSQVTTERPGEADGQTAGLPLEGLEVRVVDEAGVTLAPDQPGEVQVRGPTVTRLAHGWLSTKDLGALDSRGRLTIHARRVDLIISGGENVYPAEVEAVLAESGLVHDVAVAPLADAIWGQVPVAYVVWRDREQGEALLSFARARLAAFKVPRALVSLEELPRNATGKLLRHRLGTTSVP